MTEIYRGFAYPQEKQRWEFQDYAIVVPGGDYYPIRRGPELEERPFHSLHGGRLIGKDVGLDEAIDRIERHWSKAVVLASPGFCLRCREIKEVVVTEFVTRKPAIPGNRARYGGYGNCPTCSNRMFTFVQDEFVDAAVKKIGFIPVAEEEEDGGIPPVAEEEEDGGIPPVAEIDIRDDPRYARGIPAYCQSCHKVTLVAGIFAIKRIPKHHAGRPHLQQQIATGKCLDCGRGIGNSPLQKKNYMFVPQRVKAAAYAAAGEAYGAKLPSK